MTCIWPNTRTRVSKHSQVVHSRLLTNKKLVHTLFPVHTTPKTSDTRFSLSTWLLNQVFWPSFLSSKWVSNTDVTRLILRRTLTTPMTLYRDLSSLIPCLLSLSSLAFSHPLPLIPCLLSSLLLISSLLLFSQCPCVSKYRLWCRCVSKYNLKLVPALLVLLHKPCEAVQLSWTKLKSRAMSRASSSAKNGLPPWVSGTFPGLTMNPPPQRPQVKCSLDSYHLMFVLRTSPLRCCTIKESL